MLVEDSIYDEFVERSVERAKNRTIGNPFQVSGVHRRRINTEEKVIAAVWGTEFIQFLATLASYFAPGQFEEYD